MCTIIGWKGKLSVQMLRHMIGMSHEYGPHSVGVAYTDVGGRARVFKRSKHPFSFLRDHGSVVSSAARSPTGLAHTRFASVGAVNEANAHPFTHKGVIYSHNGTIHNWRELNDSVTSDSQVLGPLIMSQETWRAIGTAGLVWMYGGELHVYRRAKPIVVVTFHRATEVTVAATYRSMIPDWLWDFPHTVHAIHEMTAYRVNDDGVTEIWKEP